MIPQELINSKNWMLSNNKKIPCDINGIPISRNDKNNWITGKRLLESDIGHLPF